MPGLVRKILIFAAVDGLVLQPVASRHNRPPTEQAIIISYKSGAISPLLRHRSEAESDSPAYEAHGIIGLLRLASVSYLITISRRRQIAQIRGRPIYVVTDVAIIPLASQREAERVLGEARQKVIKSGWEAESDSDDSQEQEDVRSLTDVDSLPDTTDKQTDLHHKRTTSVAQDVMNKKGLYGRFAERWFSTSGWSADGRKKQGMSGEENQTHQSRASAAHALTPNNSQDYKGEKTLVEKDAPITKTGDADHKGRHKIDPDQETGNATIELLPRVLRTAKLFFASRSFYFSYDYDLSRSLSRQHGAGQGINLHNSYDPLFFWNAHLLRPFSDAGQQAFTMPIIQGFVGQRAFALDASGGQTMGKVLEVKSDISDIKDVQDKADEESLPGKVEPGQEQFLLTIISRRSIKRAGLRYLRRGVDEEGNVANSVETEQILSTPSWGTKGSKIYSFLQIRGSIPLFFSQTPYSFKPIPIFSGSEQSNAAAFRLHFQNLSNRYGDVQAVSLIDKHRTEMSIGEAYENRASKMNADGGIDGQGKQLAFEWFDFHRVCAGMNFQNVSKLIETLRPGLERSGWSLELDGELARKQSGVLRTNCMDCLDRTNVVQSATGRHALERQLAELGFAIDLQTDPSTSWFNSVWADNGDAISREYAGTAALKGDYTRTRKRNISGALTDLGLTLTRYYNNIVNDYLAQTFIDFALGNADESVFTEFEADMKAQDYAVDLRKIRQGAIDTCAKIVVEGEREDLVSGWTLSCPHVADTLRALPFEECVLLLAESALYFCRFDWGMEKVREFERVPLAAVQRVVRGVYITSTLAARDVDERRNVGFAVRYRSDDGGVAARRINTRSLAASAAEGVSGADVLAQTPAPHDPGNAKVLDGGKVLAFKALRVKSGTAGNGTRVLSEREVVNNICEELVRAVNQAKEREPAIGAKEVTLEDEDIISVAEARKSTGYLEQIGYSLKRLVWA